MSEWASFLVLIIYKDDSLGRCAIRIKHSDLKDKYFQEDYNRKILYSKLPEHISEGGRIIDVEEITDIVDLQWS